MKGLKWEYHHLEDVFVQGNRKWQVPIVLLVILRHISGLKHMNSSLETSEFRLSSHRKQSGEFTNKN